MQMPSRKRVYLAVALLCLAAAIGAAAMLRWHGGPGSTAGGTGTALVGGPFTLTDHTGKTVKDSDFRGKYLLVFFGFTFCPDVCPTELQVMAAALDQLGPEADAISPLFITIDPDRDTPDVMKAYVENFSPRLTGLTGTQEQIATVAKAYRVYYAKAGKTGTPDYTMDHSTIIYLMAKDGSFLKHFTYTTDAKALAEGIREAMRNSP